MRKIGWGEGGREKEVRKRKNLGQGGKETVGMG
jgi:hypothetical protein